MLQEISNLLFDLQEGNVSQIDNSFKNLNLNKIDYTKNSIYSIKIFKIINERKKKKEIFIQLSMLLSKDKHLENWVSEMTKFYGNNFYVMLKLNYINYKKTKRPFPA